MEERAKASGRLRALVPDVLRTESQFRLLFAGQVLSPEVRSLPRGPGAGAEEP